MQVNEENIFDEVIKMLSQEYPAVDITMDTYLDFGKDAYLGMSSMELVQFIIALEEKFDIIIDLEDRYYTIGDAVRGVVAYLKEKEETEPEEKSESKV